MHFLFSFLGTERLGDVEFAQGLEVIDEVLRDLNCLLGVEQGFFVPVELREQGADLHVDFAFIFKAFELSGCVALKDFFTMP